MSQARRSGGLFNGQQISFFPKRLVFNHFKMKSLRGGSKALGFFFSLSGQKTMIFDILRLSGNYRFVVQRKLLRSRQLYQTFCHKRRNVFDL